MPFLKVALNSDGKYIFTFPSPAGSVSLFPLVVGANDTVAFDDQQTIPLYDNFLYQFGFAQGTTQIVLEGNAGDNWIMFFSSAIPSASTLTAVPIDEINVNITNGSLTVTGNVNATVSGSVNANITNASINANVSGSVDISSGNVSATFPSAQEIIVQTDNVGIAKTLDYGTQFMQLANCDNLIQVSNSTYFGTYSSTLTLDTSDFQEGIASIEAAITSVNISSQPWYFGLDLIPRLGNPLLGDWSAFQNITFWVKLGPSASGPPFQFDLILGDKNGSVKANTSSYLSVPIANQWYKLTVPLSYYSGFIDLTQVKFFELLFVGKVTGSSISQYFLVDDIRLTGGVPQSLGAEGELITKQHGGSSLVNASGGVINANTTLTLATINTSGIIKSIYLSDLQGTAASLTWKLLVDGQDVLAGIFGVGNIAISNMKYQIVYSSAAGTVTADHILLNIGVSSGAANTALISYEIGFNHQVQLVLQNSSATTNYGYGYSILYETD